VPVSVEGHLWGVMVVEHTREEPLPAGTEARLAGFTELAATAIANAQARVELRGFAEEQAALRRVATLLARGAPPAEVLATVTEEAGRLLGENYAAMTRYDPGGSRTLVASWSSTGPTLPVGSRSTVGGPNVSTMVSRPTGLRGSTTTPAPRARSPSSPAASMDSVRLSACRSASRDGFGAS
jgi:GAF domain-containing protein